MNSRAFFDQFEELKGWWLWMLLFALFIFVTQFSIKTVDYDAREVDFQVLFRLAVYAILPFIFRRHIEVFFKELLFFNPLLALFFGILLLSALATLNFYAVYALLMNIIALFCVYSFWRIGGGRVLLWYFYAVVIFCIPSIIVYYAVPEMGRYSYWLDDIFQTSARMQGISGHPNLLGYMISAALLAYIGISASLNASRYRFVLFLFLVLCLLLTNSRTNLVATIVFGGMLVSLRYGFFRYYLEVAVAFVFLFFVLTKFLPDALDSVLGLFSRTGDVDEIFSMTGRSAIWDFVIDMIAEKPFFGWGYGNISDILFQNSDVIGFVVGQTHSLYLQILLNSGALGFVLFFGFVLVMLFRSYKHQCYWGGVVLLWMLFVGSSEALIFNTIPSTAFICFSMAVMAINSATGRTMDEQENTFNNKSLM